MQGTPYERHNSRTRECNHLAKDYDTEMWHLFNSFKRVVGGLTQVDD